ncbi:MAG: hypothetical protein QM516_13760, partial [Limnohabitans sp.]|nr:hypothetical protein [Limnohabitans sp.]
TARPNNATTAQTEAAIAIESVFGKTLTPRAVRIVPEIDPRARTFHAIAEIDNTDGALAAGLAVNAYVPQGAPREVAIVPKDALVYMGTATLVYGIRDGMAVAYGVDVLFPLGDRVAVRGPIDNSDFQNPIIIEGNERLMPNMPVAPIAPATGARP